MFTTEHWELVKNLATKLKSDGCTAVPDLWFRVCCCEHDIDYRTHMSPEGVPISRRDADRELRKCIQELKPDHWSNPIAWIYWLGVRLFGGHAYNKEK